MSSSARPTPSSSGKADAAAAIAAADLSKALKRRLSEKVSAGWRAKQEPNPPFPFSDLDAPARFSSTQMIRATQASYRAFRATVREGQSMELANVPRVLAAKQSTVLKTQQVLNTMPQLLSEIDEMYDKLDRRLR